MGANDRRPDNSEWIQCHECGGSGDMFHILTSEGIDRVVRFDEIKAPHLEGCEVLGEIECSLCGGFGVEGV